VTARIVHLVTDLDVGGAEWMLVRLSDRLSRQGCDNRVICLLPPGPLKQALDEAGIAVSSLGMRPGVPNPLGLHRLARLLRRDPPDLLQTWLYHADVLGVLAGRLARVPRVVWNLRASEVNMRLYGPTSGLTRWMAGRLSALPDAVVVNSSAGRRAHEALGYRPRRWELIPNGVDTDVFRPDDAGRAVVRRELGLTDGTAAIGVIARLDPVKGHELWLRAAGLLARDRPDLRFVLAGRGVTAGSPQLARWIGDAGLDGRVVLLGERRDIAAIDAAMDLVVMPSITEGFPNAVAEAMACGVPCIVTDVGDAAELVGDTGWVTPPGNAAGLAAACRAALAAPIDERRRRGQAARERILRQYSLDAMTASYAALYTSLLAGRID
jgi:glycosyltransferase involved in cell wall biosynthesis